MRKYNRMSRCRIGIDIGGTFTDVILYDEEEGVYHSAKTHSTPPDQSRGAVIGIEKILKQTGRRGSDVEYLSHGTTVGTNAVLEGKLAKTALITTRGFRDILEIGRQRRPRQYDFHAVKDRLLVPRELRFEVTERVNYLGDVTVPIETDEVLSIAKTLQEKCVEAVAICFIFSFQNGHHERIVKEIIEKACPQMSVFISSEVLPEYREYERTSTVVLNAAVSPVVSSYVENLESKISEEVGIDVGMDLMKSSGGLMPSTQVRSRAVETVLSGPAAGAIAISYFGEIAGYENLIGFDIGGTSTDISIVSGGKPRVTSEGKIGAYPFALPIVDINTIGAGGGSLAYMDVAGGLHVGPESAGAVPGPICYGAGGATPTITDANLCMGRLNEDFFLGGDMKVDRTAAERAIIEQIAAPMEKSLAEACQGIFDVSLANLVRAVRVSSIEKGLDPREFALVAFGGGGALFTADVARELNISTVIVPKEAGLLSAKGLLVTDHKNDYSMTRIATLDATDEKEVVGLFEGMKARAVEEFERDKVDTTAIHFHYNIDLRYAGQAYEINVPIAEDVESLSFSKLQELFDRAHKRLYWWSDAERMLEIVNLRISAISYVPKPRPVAEPLSSTESAHAVKQVRPVYFKDYRDFHDTNIYDRTRLLPGNEIDGPAVVESFDTTAVILPGNRAAVDGYGNIVISIES
jgi:N-methylhydantoinase A